MSECPILLNTLPRQRIPRQEVFRLCTLAGFGFGDRARVYMEDNLPVEQVVEAQARENVPQHSLIRVFAGPPLRRAQFLPPGAASISFPAIRSYRSGSIIIPPNTITAKIIPAPMKLMGRSVI